MKKFENGLSIVQQEERFEMTAAADRNVTVTFEYHA